jgi:general secretion pathway protein K
MTKRHPEKGVVLVTILSVMALCVTVIVAMTTRSEQATLLASRDLDQTQAQALATSAEAVAIAALRQDLLSASKADGPDEPWARIDRSEAALALGSVRMALQDESARFNLNTLQGGSPTARHYLRAIVAAAGLPPEASVRIAAALRGGRPLLQTSDLVARAGLSEDEVAALSALVTCTPDLSSTVNINTASGPLLQAMLQNPERTAHILLRRETGLITPSVLSEMGVILPAGLSLRSDVFGLRIVAVYGHAQVQTYSLIQRWTRDDRTVHATVSARKRLSSGVAPDQS